MFSNLLNGVTNTVSNFVDDPIGTSVNIATQPIRDGIDVLDGLSEGELREKAAMRLATDIAAGSALSELISLLDL